MSKIITRQQAKELLGSSGLRMADFSRCLGIDPKSISSRWRDGLDFQNYLMLKGYLADQDNITRLAFKHRENPALIALLKELDK